MPSSTIFVISFSIFSQKRLFSRFFVVILSFLSNISLKLFDLKKLDIMVASVSCIDYERRKMSVFQFTNEVNKRASPKNTDGLIFKFSRNMGYESIPRAFAQNEPLTYEARGLLISLASYPDIFKVYKAELYKQSEKNGRRKIDRA
ncbi:hypothetical protein [Enterococcus sp. AZ188]|uniref:hypothetical protein n=1 Tax=Enterococcus sp. AZ188 TaxID=2774678 RepID=UPI003D2FEE5E